MPDTVLALVPRSGLSALLTAFHRGGFGHVIRAFDPERAPLPAQLERSGIAGARLAAGLVEHVLVFIPAPQRTSQAAALAVANGAIDVELATRGAARSESVAPGLIDRAGARRERRPARPPTPAPTLAELEADR